MKVNIETRVKTIEMLKSMLSLGNAQVSSIEKSIFCKNPEFEEIYILNSKRVCFNLFSMPRPQMLSFVSNSESALAFLPNNFLANENFKLFMKREREDYESVLNFLTEKVEEGSVSSLKNQQAAIICSKCRSSNVNMQMKQTRSADEGMTLFFACVACDARWKIQ